jgi:hypothetical protein
MVDEGSHLLARLNQTAAQGGAPRDLHTGLLLLLRHIVEQADAVDELFRAGCYIPSRLQVRSILEAQMQMLFMAGRRNPFMPSPLQQRDVDPHPRDSSGVPLSGAALDQALDNRGRAYLVAETRRRIMRAEKLLTPAASAAMARRTGTATLPSVVSDPTTQAGIAKEIASLQAELAEPVNAGLDAKFIQTRGKDQYDPPWYALEKGPRTAAALARSVGSVHAYEVFYSEASATMHATDVQSLIRKGASGGTVLSPFREREDLAHLVSTFLFAMLTAYKIAIDSIRPSDAVLWQGWAKSWSDVLR